MYNYLIYSFNLAGYLVVQLRQSFILFFWEAMIDWLFQIVVNMLYFLNYKLA